MCILKWNLRFDVNVKIGLKVTGHPVYILARFSFRGRDEYVIQDLEDLVTEDTTVLGNLIE